MSINLSPWNISRQESSVDPSNCEWPSLSDVGSGKALMTKDGVPTHLLEGLPKLEPYEDIPRALESDPFFSGLECPVKLGPIRYPVRDRHNPEHIYERNCIIEWIRKDHTSPLSRLPMTLDDLEPCLELQREIECKLREYTEKLKRDECLPQEKVVNRV